MQCFEYIHMLCMCEHLSAHNSRIVKLTQMYCYAYAGPNLYELNE